MENDQEIFIKSKNSDYLHDIVQKKDWNSLIKLASSRDAFSDLILTFFSNDESQSALKEMTEEQISMLISASPVNVSNNIFDRIESICDTDEKFTNIAVKMMKKIFLHGGDLKSSSIVKCLPINLLRVIIDSRIPKTEFHFGTSGQEFFMHINSNFKRKSLKNFSYKNLKERDCLNGFFIYIRDEVNNFPLARREVYKEVINSLRDCFEYIENDENLDYKQNFVREIIVNPLIQLISRGLKDKVLDYKNDKEIIELLHGVFNDFYYSKYYRSVAHFPILNDSGNSEILIESNVFEDCKVISPNYYYKVFKKAVELNEDNFIDKITRVFFSNCRIMHHIRDLNDGVYDKLFNGAIEMTVRELVERKQSENFKRCCSYLKYNQIRTFNDFYIPKFNECLSFVKKVITMIFEKEKTLNVDVSTYPEICCYLLNTLNFNVVDLPIPRDANMDITFSLQKISSNYHSALDLLDAEMRNKLVLGIIRHPTDKSKFSHIITSNNPTTLVNFICNFHSVQDIKLILPKEKQNSIDKFGFRESRNLLNPKETCKMNLVEVFLQTLKFWENNDKSLFKDGYTSYYQFVRKILLESILTNDDELKKYAIDVYYRFSELVSLAPNAKFIRTRIQIAAYTFLTPIAVIVGSELDKSFVEKYVQKFIQPFNAQSYHDILSQIISQSHLDLNYFDDEKDILDNETDRIFKKINIDQQMATATRLLLSCIKQNPVKNFSINYNHGIQENFFISEKRVLNVIKSKFDICNPKINDVCNPLKTEYPLNITYNGPIISPISIQEPYYKISDLVFLELCRFIADEIKEYSPKMFKSNLTKSLIKIQNLIKSISKDDFRYSFFLDQPTFDTMKKEYYNQSRTNINIIYSKPFFEFLNEINGNTNSIYNSESYEIINNAFVAQFLNEEDYLQQKSKPPPKFNGFDIVIQFKMHQNSFNIFNTADYREKIKDYKLQVYQKTNSLNQNLIQMIERIYNNTNLLGDQSYDDVFQPDYSTHKSHELSSSQRSPFYKKNVHKCFTKIMDALNKCQAELFANDFDSLERIQNFFEIKNYRSSSKSYTMLTQLLDLLINEFISTNTILSKTYKNRIVNYNEIYQFMVIVAKVASPNIGNLINLETLCKINERAILQKVHNRNPDLFDSIFRNGNINQILLCMNSPLFSDDANDFYSYLLKESGQLHATAFINTLINEILNNEKQVLDDFLVSLAKCSIHPRFVGFPAPQNSLEFLKKITNKSIYTKRAACANAVYYTIMCYMAEETIPLKDITEIIDQAHIKSPDEITAFFCILISEKASLMKMSSLPALNDLMSDFALPHHYIIDQSIYLNIPKEIGDFYYYCIEKVILSGLKSKKSHIYELAVTVLNEINVGPEIHQIISPFIEKGLNEIQPNDDNEAFLTYATSFTMRNPEFKGCFDSYCEAITKIKKHSYAILKANANMKNDSPYPEPFKKLENSFSTIINTIEKPFIEFKEENEMVAASQFCRKLLPVLKKNRPAVAQGVFIHLEAYASIFGDPLIEEMIRLYNQDKKEESLSKFIVIITHHEEMVLNVPLSIQNIYYHLKSSFTVKHTIELSRNLADSQGKLPLSIERAYKLAELISPDVLSHMPDLKSTEDGDEDEIVQVLSNLGIFCKKNDEVFMRNESENLQLCTMQSLNENKVQNQQHILANPIPATGDGAYDGRTVRRLTKHYAVSREDIKKQESGDIDWTKFDLCNFSERSNNDDNFEEASKTECNQDIVDDYAEYEEENNDEEQEQAEEFICLGASIPVGVEEDEIIGKNEDCDEEGEGNEEINDDFHEESEVENELNQDQINDAFDLFF